MSSFKRLSRSDVDVTKHIAHKQWEFTSGDSNITIYQGRNVTSSFDVNNAITQNGFYESSIYDMINHMFYQSYSGSLLNTSSLMFNYNTYESASQQRPTSSYFIYNENPSFIKNFPSGANETIQVLSINKQIFGSKIYPNEFTLSSSLYNIIDDGKGNLHDLNSGSNHVGNIFYPQGLIVITNQEYQNMFPAIEIEYFLLNNDSCVSIESIIINNIPLTSSWFPTQSSGDSDSVILNQRLNISNIVINAESSSLSGAENFTVEIDNGTTIYTKTNQKSEGAVMTFYNIPIYDLNLHISVSSECT